MTVWSLDCGWEIEETSSLWDVGLLEILRKDLLLDPMIVEECNNVNRDSS